MININNDVFKQRRVKTKSKPNLKHLFLMNKVKYRIFYDVFFPTDLYNSVYLKNLEIIEVIIKFVLIKSRKHKFL